MTDDFDRHLADRLRRYESRVPAEASPDPLRSRRARRWVLAASGAAVVAATLLGVVVLSRDTETIGLPSPSPTLEGTPEPSAQPTSTPEPATTEPSPTGSSSPPAATAAPSARASAAPSVPAGWSQTASIREDGVAVVVRDMTTWSAGLIAVGTRYADTNLPVFGPPPGPEGRVWRSADGLTWADATPAGVMDGVELEHAFETADGSLVVIGRATLDSWEAEHRAWTTSDGVSWQPAAIGSLGPTDRVVDVERGAAGYLLAATPATTSGAAALWHSADGSTWALVHEASATGANASTSIMDIGAGDEGFVAVLQHNDGAESVQSVIASADGQTWFDGTSPSPWMNFVLPHGPDWIGVDQFSDQEDWSEGLTVGLWFSPNGLDWTRRGEATWGIHRRAADQTCAEFVAHADTAGSALLLGMNLTYGCSEGGFQTAGGTWMSVDGVSWTRLPLGTHATVGGAEMLDGRYVVATHAGTGLAGDTGVAFWISEQP